MRILIVEDDSRLAQRIATALRSQRQTIETGSTRDVLSW